MPICPSCRTGYDDDELSCPQCGAPKPLVQNRSFASLESPRTSRPLWSVDRLPYKLFGFAAFAHYVFAFLAVASAMLTGQRRTKFTTTSCCATPTKSFDQFRRAKIQAASRPNFVPANPSIVRAPRSRDKRYPPKRSGCLCEFWRMLPSTDLHQLQRASRQIEGSSRGAGKLLRRLVDHVLASFSCLIVIRMLCKHRLEGLVWPTVTLGLRCRQRRKQNVVKLEADVVR